MTRRSVQPGPDYDGTAGSGRVRPRWMARGLLLGTAAIGLLLSVMAIGVLAFALLDRIEAHRVASSDNVQWSLAQTEVEFLQFQLAVEEALNSPADPDHLAEVRKRFDILWSRSSILLEGEVFVTLEERDGFSDGAMAMRAFLDGTVMRIDGPDDHLAASLPDLARDAAAVAPVVRTLALTGIDVFAHRADAERTEVASTLNWLAVLTLLVVGVLLALVGALLWLDRLGERRVEQTRRALDRFRAIVDTALDAVVVTDREGRIREFNGAAEHVFRLGREEACGADMAGLLIPEHLRGAHAAGMRRYIATGERRVVGAGRVRIEARRADGSLFPSELSIASSGEGSSEIFVAFIRDLSREVAAEAELVRARDEALASTRAREAFLAVMSHEMRTPLNGLLGTLDLLADTPLSADQRELLRVLEGSGRILLRHVNDVLDIARADSGHMPLDLVPFDLPALLADLVQGQEGVAQAAGNALELTVAPDLPERTMGDPGRIQQVVLNLLGNALKFTRDGRVDVAAAPAGGDMVAITVRDSGIGIAADELERVFEDFVTLDRTYARAAEGTGLGLGIARRLARRMGGEIDVVSSPGQGSTFRLVLPLPAAAADADAESPCQDHSDAEAVPSSKTSEPVASEPLDLLLVEDNAVNRLVAGRILSAMGHRVTEAEDGEVAVRIAGATPFDAILMDISMPRLDGVEATRAIRAGAAGGASAETPIIALTAHALPAEVDRFRAAGMCEVLIKPLRREMLATAIGRVERRAGRPDRDGENAMSTSDETPAGNPALPLLSGPVLAELREDIGTEQTERFLGDFLRQGAELVSSLEDRRDDPDANETLRKRVHRLAGSAALFGASRLRDHLAVTETALKRRDAVDALLAGLPILWAATAAAVSSHLRESRQANGQGRSPQDPQLEATD